LHDLFRQLFLFEHLERRLGGAALRSDLPAELAGRVRRLRGKAQSSQPGRLFLSRRSLKASAQSGMPAWQDRLFIGLARSANDATDFFQIPTGRVVEVGTQVAV